MKQIFAIVLLLVAVSFAAMNANSPTLSSTDGFYATGVDTFLGQSDTVKGTGTAKCTLTIVPKREYAPGYTYFLAYSGATEVTGSTDSVKIMFKVYNYDLNGTLLYISATDSLNTGVNNPPTHLSIGGVNVGAYQAVKAWAYATHTVAGAYFKNVQILKRKFIQYSKQWQ